MTYDAVKSSTDAFNWNNVSGFEYIKLTNSKRQLTNIKKLLTVAKLSYEKVVVKMCHLQCDPNVASHCHHLKNVHLKM